VGPVYRHCGIPVWSNYLKCCFKHNGSSERGQFYDCRLFIDETCPVETVRERFGTFWDSRKRYSVILAPENNVHQPNAGESYTWSNLTIRQQYLCQHRYVPAQPRHYVLRVVSIDMKAGGVEALTLQQRRTSPVTCAVARDHNFGHTQ
jgi:hypothetical protein